MTRILSSLLLLTTCWCTTFASANESEQPEAQEFAKWAQNTWENMDRQTGTIILPNGVATLNVPDDFYYLSPKDAEVVLVKFWGNVPGDTTLGMLFPASYTPFDSNAWAVEIDYEEDGHVDDEDAADIDYDDLLDDMQSAVKEASKDRVAQGYESIELVGWAATPYYDSKGKKLHWAKELKFGDSEDNTLNYNIRILGRKGVLTMNFIAGINQLPQINSQLDTVLTMASFNEGQRYSDFDPSIDNVAAYGIGALIAGKAASKLGILAGLLLALKKFWIVIVAGFIGIFRWIKARFN
ncbi:DUF2167 domain-containing protein [Zooshikella harenae]|uniref:DUF2167 domain-containing protein n=1 Tax=Zooshikella harenae TaxID=2827238 RepID=A0ABS5ZF84_9GAMM|nr:DUF2167 domain-containing protein [Zooshikella harenae]MBU2712513.1 DUF2167 domain-containing protein [Zooshikella harenae]